MANKARLSVDKIELIKVRLPREILDRRDWIRYLVVPTWHSKNLGEVLEQVPDEAFAEFVEGHVQSFLDGKMPPAAIQSAVMNVADEFLSGGTVTLKAGDYIALQNEFRAKRA